MKLWPIPVKPLLVKDESLHNLVPEFTIKQFSWDTRSIQPGDTFLCLSGENYDGHKFARKAVDAGASAVIADLSSEIDLSGLPLIQVKNTQDFLWRMASFQRNRFAGQVIAITGSNGKTSTRRMATVLGESLLGKEKVHATEGNKNNHLGLPFTLLQLKEEHELAVLEIGTNHPGEIRPLVEMAKPHATIITGIGGGHIGNFGTWQDLAIEKCSIAYGLDEQGTCVLPEDLKGKPEIQKIIGEFRCIFSSPEFRAELSNIQLSGSEIKIFGNKTILPFPGRHMVSNFELVVECFLKLGHKATEISAQLDKAFQSLSNEPGRLQVKKHESGLRIINDSYNANAESVLAALRLMVESCPESPKGLFLGEMGELGGEFEQDHLRCLQYANEHNFNPVVLFLSATSYIDKQSLFEQDAEVLNRNDKEIDKTVEKLLSQIPDDGVLLVKGSRSTKMDLLPGLNL